MLYQAVIFDCDGVLVESEVITARIWVEMAAELGYPLEYGTALRAFKGGEMAKCVAWLEARLGRARGGRSCVLRWSRSPGALMVTVASA